MSSVPSYDGPVLSLAKAGSVYGAPWPVIWKSTEPTPPGAPSAAVAATGALPRRLAAAAGTVSVPLGTVRSTVVRTSSVRTRPAPSVARTRSSRMPSPGSGHEAE